MIKYVPKRIEDLVEKDTVVLEVWLEFLAGEPTIMVQHKDEAPYKIVTLEKDGTLYKWGGIHARLGFQTDGARQIKTRET